jgi:hypothetical protein
MERTMLGLGVEAALNPGHMPVAWLLVHPDS